MLKYLFIYFLLKVFLKEFVRGLCILFVEVYLIEVYLIEVYPIIVYLIPLNIKPEYSSSKLEELDKQVQPCRSILTISGNSPFKHAERYFS